MGGGRGPSPPGPSLQPWGEEEGRRKPLGLGGASRVPELDQNLIGEGSLVSEGVLLK